MHIAGQVEARQELSRLAVMVQGYWGARVARQLGVKNSCITRSLSLGGQESPLNCRGDH